MAKPTATPWRQQEKLNPLIPMTLALVTVSQMTKSSPLNQAMLTSIVVNRPQHGIMVSLYTEGRCFEQQANTFGVKIKAYHGDNGIMAECEYLQHIEEDQQTVSLARVNNHSQNGIAECSICTICDWAHTMLLHAVEHWPEAVGLDLWSFALKLAVDIHNATPGPSSLSPEEIFSKQKCRLDRIMGFHNFGCDRRQEIS
jgi:hypothetical protein